MDGFSTLDSVSVVAEREREREREKDTGAADGASSFVRGMEGAWGSGRQRQQQQKPAAAAAAAELPVLHEERVPPAVVGVYNGGGGGGEEAREDDLDQEEEEEEDDDDDARVKMLTDEDLQAPDAETRMLKLLERMRRVFVLHVQDPSPFVCIVKDAFPQHVVQHDHLTDRRTLNVFGGPGNLDPATFARAVLGESYASPPGVHGAQYVSFPVTLTHQAPAWMVNDPKLHGAEDALETALQNAFPFQPSVDMQKVDGKHRVYLYALATEQFDVKNALVLAAFVERVHVVSETPVGLRVGLYTDPEARAPQPEDVPAAQILGGMTRFAGAEGGTCAADGKAYSMIAHPGSAKEYELPRRLGNALCDEWTKMGGGTDNSAETKYWSCMSDGVVEAKLMFLAQSLVRNAKEEYAGYAIADMRLPRSCVTIAGTTYFVFAHNADMLRNTFVRLRIYERKLSLSNDEEAKKKLANASARVDANSSAWLVPPATPADYSRWMDVMQYPRVGEDDSCGIRTMTAHEMRVLESMWIVVQPQQQAYKPVGTRVRTNIFTVDGGAVRLRFLDFVRAVNEHVKHHATNLEARQLCDARRIAAAAYPFKEGAPFRVDLTLGFIIAPQDISTGLTAEEQKESAHDKDSGLAAADALEYENSKVVPMQNGEQRVVIPFDQRRGFVLSAAWRRARAPVHD